MDPSRSHLPTGAFALADGLTFVGAGHGTPGIRTAEIVFNTAMTGYQEILTDPSYAGQIVTFTFSPYRQCRRQSRRCRGTVAWCSRCSVPGRSDPARELAGGTIVRAVAVGPKPLCGLRRRHPSAYSSSAQCRSAECGSSGSPGRSDQFGCLATPSQRGADHDRPGSRDRGFVDRALYLD